MAKLNRTVLHKKSVIEALKKNLGIVSKACESASISRTQYYTWVETDPVFKAEVESIQELAIDHVESKLFEKIDGVVVESRDGESIYATPPSDTAIIFYLKTKGKKRGYIEKTEVDATNHLSGEIVVKKRLLDQ